jgi:uncharacterized protein (TIGR03083 family)
MADTWQLIETERQRTADALQTLPAQQWDARSLCRGWLNKEVLAHIVATAEMSTGDFFARMLRNGFRFTRMSDNDIRRVGQDGTPQLVERLRVAAGSHRHPPGPVASMLMEIVVHGEDIAFGTGHPIDHSPQGLVGAADFAKNAQPLVGCRRRIEGLSLQATDTDWSTGSGPEVSGPLVPLLLAMSGRKAALDRLSGAGVAILRERD